MLLWEYMHRTLGYNFLYCQMGRKPPQEDNGQGHAGPSLSSSIHHINSSAMGVEHVLSSCRLLGHTYRARESFEGFQGK